MAWSRGVVAVVVATVLSASGSVTAGEASPVAAPAFLVERTRVWLDRSAYLPFEVGAPQDEARELVARVEAGDVLTVLRPPTVAPGETLGWLRVRGDAPGTTTLWVGESSLTVEVVPSRAAARLNQLGVEVVAPTPGAAVWGTVTVGVELLPGPSPVDAIDLALVLPDGSRLSPDAMLSAAHGPARRMTFALDADALAPGPTRLAVVARAADGRREARAEVDVVVVRAEPSALIAGECEDHVAAPRPSGYGEVAPRVGAGAGASGGATVLSR